ncbi:MAG: AraC family transcriptional regulator [Lachnospiraceae bacterium]|nr:AraC family transcriptional regulator [Lachnospiraceae bacterium]MBR5760935.1 AraC family transcriptional regulator [Lachnospiraceae bacterium]
MEWTESLQESISYIEAHLLEEINYEDAAKHVHTSSYEFHRAFSFLTGMTVGAYIRNRRLSLAGREIVETDARITDIAMKYGYDTPESFTKAFTRFHGVAPSFARAESAKLRLFNPLVIKLTVEGGLSMDYRIVQTEAKKFIAIARPFKNEIINDEDNHEIPDFWGEVNAAKLLEPIKALRPAGKCDLYGLCTPTREGSETFDYGIGVIVDKDTKDFDMAVLESKGYRIWDVNPGTYVVFECIGDDGDCISETWERFYKEFLPQMGYESSEETDYEVYFDAGKPGVFCELWIPVKKK